MEHEVQPVAALGIAAEADAGAGPIVVLPHVEPQFGGDRDVVRQVLAISEDKDRFIRVIAPWIHLLKAPLLGFPRAANRSPWLGKFLPERTGEDLFCLGGSDVATARQKKPNRQQQLQHDRETPQPAFFTSAGRWITVCHCFAEAVRDGTPHHCLPYVKQWHTVVKNAGQRRRTEAESRVHLWAPLATGNGTACPHANNDGNGAAAEIQSWTACPLGMEDGVREDGPGCFVKLKVQ